MLASFSPDCTGISQWPLPEEEMEGWQFPLVFVQLGLGSHVPQGCPRAAEKTGGKAIPV